MELSVWGPDGYRREVGKEILIIKARKEVAFSRLVSSAGYTIVALHDGFTLQESYLLVSSHDGFTTVIPCTLGF